MNAATTNSMMCLGSLTIRRPTPAVREMPNKTRSMMIAPLISFARFSRVARPAKLRNAQATASAAPMKAAIRPVNVKASTPMDMPASHIIKRGPVNGTTTMLSVDRVIARATSRPSSAANTIAAVIEGDAAQTINAWANPSGTWKRRMAPAVMMGTATSDHMSRSDGSKGCRHAARATTMASTLRKVAAVKTKTNGGSHPWRTTARSGNSKPMKTPATSASVACRPSQASILTSAS
jgi:hypothetical protein